MKLLLDRGADLELRDNLGMSPLAIAVEESHVELVGLLLRRGADINAASTYDYVRKPISTTRTALQIASAEDHLELVGLLLKERANMRTRRFMVAERLCKQLLEKGA